MKNIIRNIKVIFMGTPDFSVPALDAIINNFKLLAVVTQPDKKVGRKQVITPSPVKKFVLDKGYEILQPASLKGNIELISRIKELQPDLIVVVAYGFILPPELIAIPKYGVINIHASLLPKYRGASPIQSAILNGDKQTGISVMLIDDKMDHGALLAQKTITITDYDNFESLHNKLSQLGADLLLDTVPKFYSEQIKPVPQDESKATYCKLITKEDGKIDWNKFAEEIDRQIRAFTPWPGTWTEWKGKSLKVIKSKVIKSEVGSHKVGEVFKVNDGIAIACGKDALEILELQLEGKKPMTAKEFSNGYGDLIGAILK
ncbi:MAG: methionyl-tRNA formyltransferase [Candidatus Parcubacteria bacterium]|nr:methionyl-tRNA formyltransferase [Candidatus Parcubacteria bacterium]